MATDGVWIGNRIYWTLTHNPLTAYYKSLSHIHRLVFLVTVFTSSCSVAAPNIERSSSGFPNCQQTQLPASVTLNWRSACILSLSLSLSTDWLSLWFPDWVHLTPTSYSSNCRLKTLYRLMAAGPVYIYSARTPQITPLPTVLPLLHDTAIGTDRVHSFPTVTGLLRVTQPSPNNSRFSGFTVLVFTLHATILI
jgi:hypothetical protein